MDYEETKSAAEAAWEQVLAHPMADLRRYLTSIGVELKGGAKPTAKHCPFCEGNDCFSLLQSKSGGMIYKCHHSECPSAGKAGGIESFIQLKDGCDWKAARAILHRVTGIPNPWDDYDPKAGRKKAKAKAPVEELPECSGDPLARDEEPQEDETPPEDPPGDAPDFIRIPDLGRNIYEEAWLLLDLSPTHRQELAEKRGLDPSWIQALGFKTSRRGNRELLQPLLEKFPVNELLRSGIAMRDRREWKKLVVSDQLCGKAVIKDADGSESYGDDERIIIPYIDGEGRIIGLRPHKMGLSNKAHRDDMASGFYEKNHHNLRIVYGEHFLNDRAERHEHRVVICEGEFKAAALGYCGIPAIGFQGIEYLWQNKETGQAERELVAMLRKHKIREVVVVFDREDKSGRKMSRRKDEWIAEIWSRYTAMKLEDNGFTAYYGLLPEAWMIDKKADWDSRLAWHVKQAKGNVAKGREKAAAEFGRLLADRTWREGPKREDGRKGPRIPPPVMKVPRQMDAFPSIKEDVIWQELNRLNFEPECFKGGQHEIDLAAEISSHCHPLLSDLLGVAKIAQNLRKSYGGYYVVKPPGEKTELRTILLKQMIQAALEGETLEFKDKVLASVMSNLDAEPDSEEKTRGLRAALMACNTILFRNPKPFSDFTIQSKYKVIVSEPDGTTRKDRLCIFIDSNGRKSRAVQIDWSKMASSQEARKLVNKLDGHHFIDCGQHEIDRMVALVDVDNYQQTIAEIDTYGDHRESGIYLLGDCAWAEDRKGEEGRYLFPDKNGIIWHGDIGYKNSEALDSFCHKPPVIFPDAKDPKATYEAIDWMEEQREVQKIWSDALAIGYDSFGDYAGYAMIGGILQYLAHPESLNQLPGKPGLFVQGAKGSGKTTTISAFIRMLGYVSNYGILGLTGTKVGIERSLSQFDCLPVHLDEWRNADAPATLVGFIRNAFNGLAVTKGTQFANKAVRLSRAATMPIITGEDMTTDTALLSRYLRLTMSASARTGTTEQQIAQVEKMLERSNDFYRIGRMLIRQRARFGRRCLEIAKSFASSKKAITMIRDDRARGVTGLAYAALLAAQEFIMNERFEHEESIEDWFLDHGSTNATEIEKDVFRLRWFSDCVDMIIGGADQNAKKFLQVRRMQILDDNRIKEIRGNVTDVELAGLGRRLICVAAGELFAAYQMYQSKRKEGVPIDIRNIRHELAREPRFWITPPKHSGNGQHRFRIEGFESKWWVMDYENAGDLKTIVEPIYRKFLYDHDLEIDETDGSVRRRDGTDGQIAL